MGSIRFMPISCYQMSYKAYLAGLDHNSIFASQDLVTVAFILKVTDFLKFQLFPLDP